MSATEERVRALVEPLLGIRSIDVYDVELTGATLRVLVDTSAGIDLDQVADATDIVSRALDDADPLPGRYTLEVSSPGVERALRVPAHFHRYVGAEIAVKAAPNVEGERRLQGTLDAADDEGIEVAGRRLAYADVAGARTVFRWGPAPKPGKGAGKSGPKQVENVGEKADR